MGCANALERKCEGSPTPRSCEGVDVNLWICALECRKSMGRITTAGGKRLKSNGADFAFRGGGEYAKTRTKKAHFAPFSSRCSGSPAAGGLEWKFKPREFYQFGSTSERTFLAAVTLSTSRKHLKGGEQSSCYSPTFHCRGRAGRHYWSRPEDAR